MEQNQENHWTLDKRVPLGIITSLIIQTLFIVWYASGFISDTENRLTRLEDFKKTQVEQYKFLPEKITKLEVQQQYTNDMLKEILSEIKQNQRDAMKRQNNSSEVFPN